ncbi:hypothetical protein AB9P05_04615 [Roseivirga sp. BDSF3-8]|uniref:hypothetical protein n=1 Tax=Roseivirga sp. BDSF3-8 TaxID=3241598 RepID=UPI0035326CDD
MDFEIVAIGITVFHGIGIVMSIFSFLFFRDIFTQKILFLNEKLEPLDIESRRHYKIHPYISFGESWKGFGYPPPFKIQYMINPTYAGLHWELEERRKKLGVRIIKLMISFLVIMSALGIVYLLAG